jgi:hypothetical protein
MSISTPKLEGKLQVGIMIPSLGMHFDYLKRAVDSVLCQQKDIYEVVLKFRRFSTPFVIFKIN